MIVLNSSKINIYQDVDGTIYTSDNIDRILLGEYYKLSLIPIEYIYNEVRVELYDPFDSTIVIDAYTALGDRGSFNVFVDTELNKNTKYIINIFDLFNNNIYSGQLMVSDSTLDHYELFKNENNIIEI